MSNSRFPHTCTISRTDESSQFDDGTSTLLYSGSCRKELNKWDDAHYVNSANTAIWILSVPIRVKVKFGDTVSVDDGICEIKGNETQRLIKAVMTYIERNYGRRP